MANIRAAAATLGFLLLGFLAPTTIGAEEAPNVRTSHAISLFGDIKYGPDFKHFDYVDPDAPRGGHIRRGVQEQTFDSLNPFILRGTPAGAVGIIYETLTTQSFDEPATEYGLIAHSITRPADYSWVEFVLRPEARWHDGKRITPEDVIFSFETITKKGAPFYAYYYRNVVRAEKTGPNRVRFEFSEAGNRELPHIMGQLPILPEHYWESREFDEPSLEAPLGSGPYKVGEIKPGRSISFERVIDYWGRDLPVNRGAYNFDRITYEYYRDSSVALEAFKAGAFDFRSENAAKTWATEYNFPALKKGQVIKREIEHRLPTGMQAFVFNTRRAKFSDRRVRQAMGLAYDHEWTNTNIFFGQYTRTQSFFSNSDLASTGVPSDAELALLEPFREELPPEVFSQPFTAPMTDGSGNNRDNLRRAVDLLKEAGWKVQKGVLTHTASGERMDFEILMIAGGMFDRVVSPFVDNLKRLGVRVRMRPVDPAQYEQRIEDFDFDMIIRSFGQSLSPGNEQREYWSSQAADRRGSRNVIGIKNPAVDDLIEKIIYAKDRVDLITATRALDRVLLHNHYVIPQHHIRTFRVAYWNRLGIPEIIPDYHHGFPITWWVDPEKDAALGAARQ